MPYVFSDMAFPSENNITAFTGQSGRTFLTNIHELSPAVLHQPAEMSAHEGGWQSRKVQETIAVA